MRMMKLAFFFILTSAFSFNSYAELYSCPSTYEIRPIAVKDWKNVSTISLAFDRAEGVGTPGRSMSFVCFYKTLSQPVELYMRTPSTQSAACPVGDDPAYAPTPEVVTRVNGMNSWLVRFKLKTKRTNSTTLKSSSSCEYEHYTGYGGAALSTTGTFRNCGLHNGSTDSGSCSH